MIRRPPRSTRTDTLFPTRRSSDLALSLAAGMALAKIAAASPDGLKQRIDEAGLWPVNSQWRESNAPLLATVREAMRSEGHTSELQSLMRISYAVFCLKNKNNRRL